MLFDTLSYITIGALCLLFVIALGYVIYKDIRSGHFWDTPTGDLTKILLGIATFAWIIACLFNVLKP